MAPDSTYQRTAEFINGAILGRRAVSPAAAEALTWAYKGSGTYAVPRSYRALIINEAAERSKLFGRVNRVSAGHIRGGIPLPTGKEAQWNPSPLTCHTFIPEASGRRETDDDAAIEAITEILAHDIDEAILLGSGVNMPRGMVRTPEIRTLTPKGALEPAHLERLVEMLPKKYQPNAKWLISDRRFVTLTIEGRKSRSLLIEYAGPGRPMLMGSPCLVVGGLPDDSIFYGDLSRYTWAECEEAAVAVASSSSLTGSGEMFEVTWTENVDGFLAMPDAFVRAVGFLG